MQKKIIQYCEVYYVTGSWFDLIFVAKVFVVAVTILLYSLFWAIPRSVNVSEHSVCSVIIGGELTYEDGADRVFQNVGT